MENVLDKNRPCATGRERLPENLYVLHNEEFGSLEFACEDVLGDSYVWSSSDGNIAHREACDRGLVAFELPLWFVESYASNRGIGGIMCIHRDDAEGKVVSTHYIEFPSQVHGGDVLLSKLLAVPQGKDSLLASAMQTLNANLVYKSPLRGCFVSDVLPEGESARYCVGEDDVSGALYYSSRHDVQSYRPNSTVNDFVCFSSIAEVANDDDLTAADFTGLLDSLYRDVSSQESRALVSLLESGCGESYTISTTADGFADAFLSAFDGMDFCHHVVCNPSSLEYLRSIGYEESESVLDSLTNIAGYVYGCAVYLLDECPSDSVFVCSSAEYVGVASHKPMGKDSCLSMSLDVGDVVSLSVREECSPILLCPENTRKIKIC